MILIADKITIFKISKQAISLQTHHQGVNKGMRKAVGYSHKWFINFFSIQIYSSHFRKL